MGVGATNATLMLGDAIVPATKLLLSVHAAYFAQMTLATLMAFLAASLLARQTNSKLFARGLAVLVGIFLLNGGLSAAGTY